MANQKFKSFNPSNICEVEDLIKAKLKELEAETGLRCSIRISSYKGGSFGTTLTISPALEAVDGVKPTDIFSDEQLEWNQYCRKFGLEPELFGKEFRFRGEMFQIVGIKKYAETRPILAKNLRTGKQYVFPKDYLNPQI